MIMIRRAIVLSTVAIVLLAAGLSYDATKGRPAHVTGQLTIFGSSQSKIFEPVLAVYHRLHPETRVRYVDLDGETIYRRALDDAATGRPGADILLSTAMDLQVKFVNDGYSMPYVSAATRALPPWARWRDEAFGVALEPAVMVFNTRRMAGRVLPTTRAELVAAIQRDRAFWHGRVGIYDLRRRGIGYLLTSQESRQASDFGALMKAFGTASAQLESGSGTMLHDVAAGNLALGYDVLESNARRQAATGAPLAIVYPYDFTLAVLHVVVIPRNATHPDDGKAFLDFLLSPVGQDAIQHNAGFNPIWRNDLPGGSTQRISVFRPVPLGPQLLVYLDSYKQRRLLANWQSLVSGTPVAGR
jgi:iron(III) transport system substrate-binding protein